MGAVAPPPDRFLTGWTRRDWAEMWHALAPSARAAYPEARFAAAYNGADRAAGVRWVRLGKLGGDHDGENSLPVRVGTAEFGILRGTIGLTVSEIGNDVGVVRTRRCGCLVCGAARRCIRVRGRGRGRGRSSRRTGRRLMRRRLAPRSPGK